MAMELEDDVFFADLSRQIALLIMDDDEEFPVQSPPVHVQGFHHVPQVMLPPPYMYEMALRRDQSKGTGVFIPRSSIPRRKNRPGRSTMINNSQRVQVDKSEVAVSQVANNDGRMRSTYAGALKNGAN